MRFAASLLALLLGLVGSAWAQEQAFTNRSTELKERAGEGRTLATLADNTAVKVLERSGGWTRVEAGGQSGWVRVFHLRFPTTVETGGGNIFSSAASAIGGGRTQKSTTIATTGVRGLSPEDLKNASPDNAALSKMQSYRANKDAAERFAREGKLASVSVESGDESKGGRR